ncbi:hypothetical protein O6H91_17G001300 [Diphasiastrum complanatum]|uniref:Uncharacterized protein n=3 Tax=Diphasiastrum complanatum TaxID=34168 RepID=A0ACC2B3M5_DIPCM|nr:hypothetical protein O6H91_17G001300 [Diphasiastrum complanatum]KAJ7524350.1 hypothetical protein O6H91_17G001300 [Diphasiastrum complanatum]KAJ7524351.1 hypothetical protein O6H91_17G001300 [Diphasiastrum complanatum]
MSEEKVVELHQHNDVQDAIAFYDKLFRDSFEPKPADLEEALARLQGCAHARPRPLFFSVHNRIAVALKFLGRRREAIAKFDQLEQLCHEDGETGLEALCCIEQGLLLEEIDEEASRRVLLRGLALAQESGDEIVGLWSSRVSRGRYVLGKLLCYSEDYENALGYLQGLDDAAADPAALHYFLGLAHGRVAKTLVSDREQAFEKALDYCRSCIQSRPQLQLLFWAHKLMGDIYLDLQNYEKARQVFAEAARLAAREEKFKSESRFWWITGSVETIYLGRQDKAIESFTSSLEAAFKIEDATDQATCLLDASTWLKKTLSLVQGNTPKWMPNTKDNLLSQTSVTVLHAEALGCLGGARVQNGMLEEGRQCFQDAVSLISNECNSFSQESFELNLFYWLQWALAELASQFGEWEEAWTLYKKCKGIAQSEKMKLRCDIHAGFALQFVGRCQCAFEAFTKAMEEYSRLLETEWDVKAELLTRLGQALLGLGNLSEGISTLEAARKILEEQQVFQSEILALNYLALFCGYVENQQVWDAFQLAKSFQAILNKYPKESSHQYTWELMSGVASSSVVNYEEAVETFNKLVSTQSNSDWMLQYGAIGNLANSYKNLGEFDDALLKYEEAWQLVPKDQHLFFAHIRINRAEVYMQKAFKEKFIKRTGSKAFEKDNSKAFQEYESAISILECLSHPDVDALAKAYAGQATILVRLKDPKKASNKLEKARLYAGNNRILIAKLKYVQAHLYHLEAFLEPGKEEGDLKGALAEAAIAETRESAILFATLQMELHDLESAWVSLLGGEMKHVFIFMQCLLADETYREAPDYLKALLWAERGRMRLFFHLMGHLRSDNLHTKQMGKEDPLWFDKDDELAKECIHQAIRSCGSEAAIVEYTYAESEGYLYIYVVLEQASELSVHFQYVGLQDYFANNKYSGMGKTLNALIKRTRSEIVKRADDKAMLGLSILYTLLLEPIWQYIEGCSIVIFAPHENLSLVPFAALYNKEQKEFLIEQKAVGIIPSIRALLQCFSQQSAFEEGMQAGTLAVPFVAGNPEPMGLGLLPLEGAAKEAHNVAKKLYVEPLVGLRMTKDAVIDGLRNASVVVLVTHGIVNNAYPHGALVMQGPGPGQGHCKKVNAASATSLRSLVVSRMLGRDGAIQAVSRTSEVLTANEVGKLEGGIRAGLVVLSACQTGEGEVSSEGLLGLGRAVLQAGASSVVLTLWKVDDDSTKDLVTGLFQHLVDNNQTIVVSMQSAMLHMLKSGVCIYKWAPLMALGSPTLKLVKSSRFSPKWCD